MTDAAYVHDGAIVGSRLPRPAAAAAMSASVRPANTANRASRDAASARNIASTPAIEALTAAA